MRNEKIKRLPVLLNNQLVGIISFIDVMASESDIDDFFFD